MADQTQTTEREVFRYQSTDGRSVRVVVSGPVDEAALESLEAFISHRRSEAAGELVS